MSNSFDTSGNQHFTRFSEWEAACQKRGLQGPIDRDGGKWYTDSNGWPRASWTSTGGQGHGVIKAS